MAVVSVREIARGRVRPDNKSGRTAIVGRIPPDRLRMTVRPESFGERVRRLRCALDWDQRQLALVAGVGQMTVSQCERDLLPGVTAYTIASLARALNVTMEHLWSGEESAS